MLQRFGGTEGKRRLVESLSRQQIVLGQEDLAQELCAVCELRVVPANDILISQGDGDTDVFLIVSGRLAIEINGREVAIREAGTHVGEMSALDPAAPRTATVRALEDSVVARIGEPELAALAERYPPLWRNAALALARRLRERSRFIRLPNPRPHLFVGSSKEMLPVAQGIKAGLAYDDVTVVVWTDGVFRASRASVASLVIAAEQSDYGLLVLGADDVVLFRGSETAAPRDNVVFELGLFMGAIGTDRTYIVKARGMDIRIPSDLLGVTPIEYEHGEDLAVALAPVCTELRRLIVELGVK